MSNRKFTSASQAWKSCGGKIGYTTWSKAQSAIKRTLRIGGSRGHSDQGHNLSAYACPFCKYFHIGHTPRIR